MRTLFDVFYASSPFDVLLAQANGALDKWVARGGATWPGLLALLNGPPIAKLLCCMKGQQLCDRMLLWYVTLAN
jgi:hypothetical protein